MLGTDAELASRKRGQPEALSPFSRGQSPTKRGTVPFSGQSPFLLAVTCALALAAGCSTHGADEGKIAIAYTRWGDPAELESTRDLIGQFMRENPDIVVRTDIVAWRQYWQKMSTAAVTGTAQDVWLMSPSYVEQYAAAGHLLDLMPFIKADPTFNIDDYWERSFDVFSYAGVGNNMRYAPFGKGKLYAFARDFNCSLLYYNRDHFDAAGVAYPTNDWTWDDLVAAAKKLTIDFDGDGIIDQWGCLGGGHQDLARVNGSLMVDPVTRKGTCCSPENLSAIKFCWDMIYKYKISPAPQIQIEGDAFIMGKASIIMEGVWEIRNFNRSKNLWDIAMVPVDVKGRQRHNESEGMGHCIYSGTKNPEAAWRLVKFLSGESSQRALARSGTSVPVLKSIAYGEDFLAPFDRPPRSSFHTIFEMVTVKTDPPLFTRGYLDYEDNWRKVLQGVWSSTTTPEEACKKIDAYTDMVLAQEYGTTK
jgi:multiple sugar transport system substrate-binding protein